MADLYGFFAGAERDEDGRKDEAEKTILLLILLFLHFYFGSFLVEGWKCSGGDVALI